MSISEERLNFLLLFILLIIIGFPGLQLLIFGRFTLFSALLFYHLRLNFDFSFLLLDLE